MFSSFIALNPLLIMEDHENSCISNRTYESTRSECKLIGFSTPYNFSVSNMSAGRREADHDTETQ